MITRKEFESKRKVKPRYLVLFDFFKKNKNKAYSSKDLMKEFHEKIGLSKAQLTTCLADWKKNGFLEHKKPNYIITSEGIKNTGRLKWNTEEKRMYPY